MSTDQSVQGFDPAAAPVALTPAAVAHCRRQLDRAGARAVRLGVSTSGCSGYMYTLDYVSDAAGDDAVFAIAGDDGALELHVTAEALPLVRGTRVDYVRDGVNSLLKFENPNAQSECGCGESFTV